MRSIVVFCLSCICLCAGEEYAVKENVSNSQEARAAISDMVMAFVVFRHGDRTPDQEELDKFPSSDLDPQIFFPYGKKSLTNIGKRRAFSVGQYLRKRYDNIISKFYLPEEIKIQTTDYARTKMTALTALAAIYPPPPLQQWLPNFNWQPIPYDTPSRIDDEFLPYFNCPRYVRLKDELYQLPEIESYLKSSQDLLKTLSENTGSNISVPEDVFILDNLFQTLNNVNVSTPKWAEQVMPKIKEMTEIEYSLMYYTDELIRLSAGGLLTDIINVTNAKIKGDKKQPNLFLYSAHENNVAALLAATRTFIPHQPKYGSTVSLELWKDRMTDEYSFMVVYAAEAGGDGVMLPVNGCGDRYLCDYNTFLKLTQDYVLPHSEYKKRCV
ncbi:venom acid phosphatase Acph-1-like [Pieris rapae]|uniref:venom acid phosphatase Acph-1-like n=1 Tax=Pieris rapae TaxID=64459 RepID=UPI000B92765C|nr:venom acid phosphatase Acph-1-like [Pieris rapae]